MSYAEVQAVNKNHGVYFVPGLQRGLLVLEAIAAAKRPLTVSNVAEELSLSRSSVFRLIYTLRHMGFFEAAELGKTFKLGPRVLNLGFAYLASKNIIELAQADLEILRDATNVSSHLAIRDGRDVLYLSCVHSQAGFQANINVGKRLPAYATPLGWFLLSDFSTRQIEVIIGDQALVPLTDQTPTNIAELSKQVVDVASAGYAISRGGVEVGGSSISAPVFDHDGSIVAAIDISGPDSAFDFKKLEMRYVDEVVSTASRISARLGYRRLVVMRS